MAAISSLYAASFRAFDGGRAEIANDAKTKGYKDEVGGITNGLRITTSPSLTRLLDLVFPNRNGVLGMEAVGQVDDMHRHPSKRLRDE